MNAYEIWNTERKMASKKEPQCCDSKIKKVRKPKPSYPNSFYLCFIFCYVPWENLWSGSRQNVQPALWLRLVVWYTPVLRFSHILTTAYTDHIPQFAVPIWSADMTIFMAVSSCIWSTFISPFIVHYSINCRAIQSPRGIYRTLVKELPQTPHLNLSGCCMSLLTFSR